MGEAWERSSHPGCRWTEPRRRKTSAGENMHQSQHNSSINGVFLLNFPNNIMKRYLYQIHFTNEDTGIFSNTPTFPHLQNVALLSVPRARVLNCLAALDVGQHWGRGPGTGQGREWSLLGGDFPWPLDQPVSQTQTLRASARQSREGTKPPIQGSDDLRSQLLSSLQSIFP